MGRVSHDPCMTERGSASCGRHLTQADENPVALVWYHLEAVDRGVGCQQLSVHATKGVSALHHRTAATVLASTA